MFGKGYAVSRGSGRSAYTQIFLKVQFVCSGVKYMIDIHLMSCEDPSPLVIGDDFVMLNQKNISMMSASTYFHSEVADIQYVGTVSVWVVSPATHHTAFGGERITGPSYHTCTFSLRCLVLPQALS